MLNDYLIRLRNIIFPKLCVICGIEIVGNEYVCPECAEKLAKEQAVLCPMCSSAVHLCSCCKPQNIRKISSPFWYKGEICKYILAMKNERYDEYFEFAASRISKLILDSEIYSACDSICYVPKNRKKQLAKGVNAPEEIAKRVSEICNIPLIPYLACSKKVKEQKTLGYKERRKNIRGAFCHSKSAPSVYGKVILLDDVFTTGSTAGECAKVLLKAGAVEVNAVFAAKAFSGIEA